MEHNGTLNNERRIRELEGGKGQGKGNWYLPPSCLDEEWLNFSNTNFEETY